MLGCFVRFCFFCHDDSSKTIFNGKMADDATVCAHEDDRRSVGAVISEEGTVSAVAVAERQTSG